MCVRGVYVCACVGVSKSSGGGGAGTTSSGAPLPKKPKPMPSTSSSTAGGASKALFADPVRLTQTTAAQKPSSTEGGAPVESE